MSAYKSPQNHILEQMPHGDVTVGASGRQNRRLQVPVERLGKCVLVNGWGQGELTHSQRLPPPSCHQGLLFFAGSVHSPSLQKRLLMFRSLETCMCFVSVSMYQKTCCSPGSCGRETRMLAGCKFICMTDGESLPWVHVLHQQGHVDLPTSYCKGHLHNQTHRNKHPG